MKKFTVQKRHLSLAFFVFIFCFFFQQSATASPFGQGEFGADVPFGSLTSISMDFSGDVVFTLTPGGGNFSGQGSHTVTITSTDVVGYKLYVLAPSGTSMSNGAATIAASSNGSAAPLAINTWGYNTDGTSNYLGILPTPSLIKDADGPYKNGDDTVVYYGVYVDGTVPASDYTVDAAYTVTAEYQ